MTTLAFCIVVISLGSASEILAVLNEETPYQTYKYGQTHSASKQNEYFQKEFKFIPGTNSWQENFAEVLSQAVEEQHSESYPNQHINGAHLPQTDIPPEKNTYWKEKQARKSIDNNEHHTKIQISPNTDAKVLITHTANNTKPLEGSTRKPKPTVIQLGQGPINISSYNTEPRYYQSEKGEILIHRPAPIIVKRPPTKVLVHHEPLIVKAAPVIFHRPPSVIVRPIYVQPMTPSLRVQPVYVKVVKPQAEKVYIKEKIPCDEDHFDNDYYPKRRYYPSQYEQ